MTTATMTMTAPATPAVRPAEPRPSRAVRSALRKWADALDALEAARGAAYALADALDVLTPEQRARLLIEKDYVRDDARGIAWVLGSTTSLIECEAPWEARAMTKAYLARQSRPS